MGGVTDPRPPFAALAGRDPAAVFAALPTPCYLLDEAALEKARTLAAYSPEALRYSKELLNIMESVGDVDTAIRIENRNQQLVKAFNRENRERT